MLLSDELQVRAPAGCTVLRIVLDFSFFDVVNAGTTLFQSPDFDLFILGQGSEQDDQGVEVWVSGTEILKPRVKPDLAGQDLAGARRYMWTKRFFGGLGPFSAVGSNATFAGDVLAGNYLPSPGGYPFLDLRVKRRLQVGENLVLGTHWPTGVDATDTYKLNFSYRMLMAGT